MNLTKKIWHDENSEPPKNYLWAKRGKLFKYVNGQWKEISKNSSNNSGVDISDFINVAESLKNSGMIIYEIDPYVDEIDQIPHRNVYGNQGDYVVMFGPEDETEESELLIAYLTEEEYNELNRRRYWHFDSHLFSGGWVEMFNPDISNYTMSIPVSKELPLWEYSEDHEYTLDDLSAGQYIVAPIFNDSGSITNYLMNAKTNHGYNVSFFLHNYSSLEDEQPPIAVKIYNETETYYFPAGISVNNGPM